MVKKDRKVTTREAIASKNKDMYMYLEKGWIKINYFGGIFSHGGVPPVHENN